MNKYQRLIDGAEVREMHDPTTGGSLHGALYGDTKSHRAFVQPLPLFSNIGSSDRAVQAAALAELTGAKVLQITSNGFRGSSLRPSHLRGYLTGNMSPHAWSVDSVLHKDRPLGDVPPQEAVFIGESLAAAPAALPTRAASVSRKRSRTSPTAVRSRRI